MTEYPVPRQVANTRLKRGHGAHFLEDDEGQPLCGANDTAAAVWELCDGATTVDEMVEAIAALACLPENQIRPDVTRILQELATVRAIDWSTPGVDGRTR